MVTFVTIVLVSHIVLFIAHIAKCCTVIFCKVFPIGIIAQYGCFSYIRYNAFDPVLPKAKLPLSAFQRGGRYTHRLLLVPAPTYRSGGHPLPSYKKTFPYKQNGEYFEAFASLILSVFMLFEFYFSIPTSLPLCVSSKNISAMAKTAASLGFLISYPVSCAMRCSLY